MKDNILQNKRKIFIAAFAIAFVSVQAVTRLKKVVKLRAEVAQITSLPPSGNYEFIGCFSDKGPTRTFPNYTPGDVKTADECRVRAEASGHDFFGLQYGAQCFTGNKDTAFNKYGFGPADQCKNPLGANWTNMVYKKKVIFTGPEWTYKGCFKDGVNTTIPNDLGQVKDLEECQKRAEDKGFNTIGLRSNTRCFAGNSSASDKLGLVSKCDTIMTWWSNSVYVKEGFEYKGCFKDNHSKMVPKFLKVVNSVEACKDLAIKGKFDTFSLQYGGECYVGNKPAYNQLGAETNKTNCPTFGGGFSNQVYQWV